MQKNRERIESLEEMTAKEYLNQVRNLESKMKILKEEIDTLREMEQSNRARGYCLQEHRIRWQKQSARLMKRNVSGMI